MPGDAQNPIGIAVDLEIEAIMVVDAGLPYIRGFRRTSWTGARDAGGLKEENRVVCRNALERSLEAFRTGGQNDLKTQPSFTDRVGSSAEGP